MRKLLANIISAFIPLKLGKHKIRDILKFGLVNYFRVKREEPRLKFKHYLSVCAIAKNEGCYFKEWVEFHRLAGVEKFYIYDNESSDNTKEILEPYIKDGIVEYTYFPGEKRQLPAYKDCVRRHKYDTCWLALIDLDEFIVPLETETIPEFLRKLPDDASQLLIGWVIYGSNGHKTKPEGLVIENYKYRAERNNFEFSCKAILNPRFVIKATTHMSSLIGKTIDPNLKERPRIPDLYIWSDNIRINHYACKSREEFARKAVRGDGIGGKQRGLERYQQPLFDKFDLNDIFDPIMDKYIEQIKKRINT